MLEAKFYVKYGKEFLMSNIGKLPINIPDGVDVNVSANSVNVKGKNGELFMEYNSLIKITNKDNVVSVSRKSDSRKDKALHGLYRALLSNMIFYLKVNLVI